jgi:hypothetical protein
MSYPNERKFIRSKIALVLILIFTVSVALISCNANPTPSVDAQIRAAVAATLASVPSPSPQPIPTIIPSPTRFSLEGVFCEYGFCIGHPKDLFLIDQGSTRQPPIPSTFGSGIIFGYSQTLFIEMAWTLSGSHYDPQQVMRLILEETENLQGNINAQLIDSRDVYFQSISTVTAALPFGGIASWQCGGRDFVWKVYTTQEGMASDLLKSSFEQFRCQEN